MNLDTSNMLQTISQKFNEFVETAAILKALVRKESIFARKQIRLRKNHTYTTMSNKVTGNKVIDDEGRVKQDKDQGVRDDLGRFKPGMSGNPNGRPPAGQTLIDKFRDNPNAMGVLNKLFQVANTLGTDNPNKDAIAAAKLIIERLVPSLKASEHVVSDGSDQPFILMPESKEPRKEDE